MATISFTSTAEQDTAVKRIVDKANAQPGAEPITAVQYVRNLLNHWLDARVAEMRAEDRRTRAELFQKATPEDQAAMDAILDKYRT